MRAVITLLILGIALSLAAQTPQTGTTQPDVKSKPAEKPPTGAPTADPKHHSAHHAMLKPAPEMERLTKMLQGRWVTEETHEPSDFNPKGGTGKGQEAVRPGPGGLSLIAEYTSQSPTGEFSGVGLMMWDPAQRVYLIHWTDNTDPQVVKMTGKWVGEDLVFTHSGMMMGKQAHSRHAFTAITPNGFTYTIDMGPTAAQLKRVMTIKYTRAARQEPFRRLGGRQ